jgi:hypothetical protein
MSDNEEFDVDSILACRMGANGALEYLVKWLNYGHESNSWVPLGDLNCPEELANYNNSLLSQVSCTFVFLFFWLF